MNVTAVLNDTPETIDKIDPAESFQVRTAMIQPWSMPVMKSWLPDKVVKLMLNLTDRLKSDEDFIDWGSKLVGQVAQETFIPRNLLLEAGVKGLFENLVTQYVVNCLAQKQPTDVDKLEQIEIESTMEQMWAVSQYENEYNPVHQHPNCNVAAVMYLKVPEMLPARKSHRSEDDGCITFIGSGGTFDDLSFPLIKLKPNVGDIYFFNSKLLHTVNPFRCSSETRDTERRSVSFNCNFRVTRDPLGYTGKASG